jgi:predicted nucleotidyltransferase
MRLSRKEVLAIKTCVSRHFGNDAVVRLFGSRTNDAGRGGDIDLHIVTGTSELPTLAAECDFYEDLVAEIGEQRIDTVVHPRDFPMRPIDHIAINEGTVL